MTELGKEFMMDINELIPYEFNNKEHDETQINRIANSIKEFGFTQRIVIDKDNVVIIWHGRLEAAKKLWMKEVPVVKLEDLTPTQVKKLRILDNKLNESEWNLANLKMELDDLWDLNIWELDMSISDLFPEFDAPEFNPDDYWDEEDEWEDSWEVQVIVYVKDEAEASLLKDDLKNLWYTKFK